MAEPNHDAQGNKRPRETYEIVTTEEIAQRVASAQPSPSTDSLLDDYSDHSDADEEPRQKRFRLDIADDTTEEFDDDDDDENENEEGGIICPLCKHATSDLVRDLDTLADKLAGRASHEHVTAMQLEIFERRVAPLRYEGRDDIPNINKTWLHKHYTECRISPMRSVSQDIRMFEEAENLLRANLTDVDDEGASVLSSRTASELCRLSKGKMDALKFFHQLSKEREIKESNEKKS